MRATDMLEETERHRGTQRKKNSAVLTAVWAGQ